MQLFSTAVQKQLVNHSWKILGVSQSLRLELQIMGRLALEQPLRAHGLSEGYTSRGFSLKSPTALPPSSRVRLVLSGLGPKAGHPLQCEQHVFGQLLPEQACLNHTEDLVW